MKRCNNCGWFNLDAAVRCEMCDDEGLEPVAVQSPVNAEPEKIVEPEPLEAPVPVPEPEPVVAEKKNPMMATVAFGAEQVSALPRKALTATIMDATAVMGDEPSTGQCPKCHYPVTPEVEFCPNCGTTVHKQASVQKSAAPGMATVRIGEAVPSSTPVSQKTVMIGGDNAGASFKSRINVASDSKGLKATVRDIPEELMADDKELFKLVPMDGIGEAPIKLRLGEVVVIAGKHYRFQK